MAWKGHKRPEFKFCKGCRQARSYKRDFPQMERKLKDGRTVFYAETLCKVCRRKNQNRLRREANRRKGKRGMAGDIDLALEMVRSGSSLRAAASTARVGRATIQKRLLADR
jgi:hypothetical protein